jgi:uncharacterized membrane protein YoaK (UPF0700 family)
MGAAADRLSTTLMLVLSFGTGVLDAATYLGLHGVFTANMTGNVVFVGLGIADDDGVPLLRASLALVGFVLGATVVGLVQRGRASVPNADPVAAGTLVLTGLVVAGSAAVLHAGDLPVLALDGLTAVLAWAMGAQAVAARRVGVADVTTVVVTSTLAGFAADAPWTGGRTDGRSTWRRLAAILTMTAGAVAGAFLLRLGIAVPVGVTALLLLLVGAVALARVWRARRSPVAEEIRPRERVGSPR